MQPERQPSALELLADLEARGLRFTIRDDGKLGVGPRDLITTDVSNMIASRKGDLLFALKSREPADATPEASDTAEPIDLASAPLMDLLMVLRTHIAGDRYAETLVDAVAGRLPDTPPPCDHTKFVSHLEQVPGRLKSGYAGSLTQEMLREIIDELRAQGAQED